MRKLPWQWGMCYKLLPVVAQYVAFLKPSIGRVNEIYRKGWCFEKCRVPRFPPLKLTNFKIFMIFLGPQSWDTIQEIHYHPRWKVNDCVKKLALSQKTSCWLGSEVKLSLTIFIWHLRFHSWSEWSWKLISDWDPIYQVQWNVCVWIGCTLLFPTFRIVWHPAFVCFFTESYNQGPQGNL